MSPKLNLLFRNQKPILNIYIHLPFCLQKCHFCAFPIHATGSQSPHLLLQYLAALKTEIQTSLPFANLHNPLESVYFGGGTPSLYSPAAISSIMDLLPKAIETTIELNLPELGRMQGFGSVGINRFSLGVQSFNEAKLQAMNRVGVGDPYQYVSRHLSAFRPENMNVDFMLDLMLEPPDFQRTLQFIREVKPEHITLYMMEVNQGSYIHKHISKFRHVLDDPRLSSLYMLFSKQLTSLNYNHYEVSNFSLPSKKSQHSQVYWKGNQEFAAYGMGAASLIAENRITRPTTLPDYYRYVDALPQEQHALTLQINNETGLAQVESVIMSAIRTKEGVMWSSLPGEKRVKESLLRELHRISSLRGNIINWSSIETSISLSCPEGYLLADEIAFMLIASLQGSM